MRWPNFRRPEPEPEPAPEPWTPGRVVALFDGWAVPAGTASLVSVARGGGEHTLKVTLARPSTGAAVSTPACVCDDCLATAVWPEWAARVKAGLADRMAADPFEFRVGGPASASAGVGDRAN